jgi:hypothetical protein
VQFHLSEKSRIEISIRNKLGLVSWSWRVEEEECASRISFLEEHEKF